MASKNIVEIIIKATDKASKEMKGITGTMGKLGKVAGIAGVAVAAAGVAVGVAIYKMTREAAQVEKVENTFDNLARSIGETSEVMIQDLRTASRGMLNDADLMRSSNKLVSMGLADTSKEAAKLTEMSTQLGSAMGMDATEAAEAFALMLANQSIPRLDNFGISSGKVRDRIAELMEADKDLTREQAFMNAVMEQGAITMEKVGEQGTGAAADMARLQANVDNLKGEIGKRFLPILATMSDKLVEAWNDPKIQEGISNVLDWLEKVVGDENSGIVGFITKLFEGDIAGAFDQAFGEGTWTKIQTFSDNFKTVIGGLVTIIEELAKAIGFVIDMFDKAQARSAGTGYQRMMGITPPSSSRTEYQGGRASGGPVSSGGSYLVGEQGPEILNMGGSSGHITPNNKLGGGVTVNLHIHSAVSLANEEEAKRVLMPYIESGLRTVMAR